MIFVSNFPPKMTQDKLLEGLESLKMYERRVIRMSLPFLSKAVGISERTCYSSCAKIRIFHTFE